MSSLNISPDVSLKASLARFGAKQCRLCELLQIYDSCDSSISKLDVWRNFFNERASRTFASAPPEEEHPQAFLHDVMRQTMCINGATFLHQSEGVESDSRIGAIDNEIMRMLKDMPKSPQGSSPRTLHRIRYLLQDLMHQSIFVLDPHFPANYNEAYNSHGMLLLGLNDGRKLLEYAKKEPTIFLHAEQSTVFIKAVQYWKVVDNKQPEQIKGFDAQSIEIVIDLKNATLSTLLNRFEEATCSLMFHGYRRRLQEIAY